MAEDAAPQMYRCTYCEREFPVQPARAYVTRWMRGMNGLVWACDGCRAANKPPAEWCRCPDCERWHVTADADALRTSPTYQLRAKGEGWEYLARCEDCQAAAAARLQARASRRGEATGLESQMARIREIREHLERQGTPRARASEEAVRVQMDVEDSALHLEFMRWLWRWRS